MSSFFRHLDSSMVVRAPFPHICVENFLAEEDCRQLAIEVPPIEIHTQGRSFPDDHKIYRRSPELLSDANFSARWRQIIADNLTADVFYDILRIFKEDIAREYPALAAEFGRKNPLNIGVRGVDRDCDGMLEAQLVYFMPVKGATGSERGPHVKLAQKLLGSFLCLRSDDDKSSGGDIILHGIRHDVAPVFGARDQIDLKYLTPARIIPRRRNVFVCWLNTPRSITQMTPRGRSEFPSVYLNILAEAPEKLFQLPRADTPSATAAPGSSTAQRWLGQLQQRLTRRRSAAS